MIRFRDLPIRQKLLVAVAVAVLPALLLSCVALLAHETHRQRSAMERELLATARIIGSSSATAMRLGDRKAAGAALGALEANPRVRKAVLRDERDEIVASYAQVDNRRSTASSGSTTAHDPNPAAIEVTHEIRFKGEHLGSVHLEAGLDDLNRDLASFLVTLAVICAGSALLIFLIMLQLKRVVMGPIRDLQRAKDRAESASRAKSEFLAGMSHEMRTPLHAILSFAELGGRRADSLTPEKATRYYRMIEEGGKRLLDLLNDLVDLANLEAGKRVLRFTSMTVESVVHAVVDELRPLFRSRGIGLEASSCEATSGWIDREALMQVLRYVMTNAARWSGQGGTVVVDLVRSERGSLISVTNRGTGMAQAEQGPASVGIERSSGPRNEAKGSGLKLALCREIMMAHGGRIWVEDREGGGETAYLEIPDRKSPEDEGEAPRSAAAA